MNLILKKSISLMLSISLILSLVGSSVFAESNNTDTTGPFNLQTIQNDTNKIVVKAEYEGDEAYATLDIATNAITLQTIEHPEENIASAFKTMLKMDSDEAIIRNYDVDIHSVEQTEQSTLLSATIIDKLSKEEITIDNTKVKAQLPVVVGLAEILGPPLIAYLTRIAAVTAAGLVVGEAIKDKVKNEKPEYYEAQIDYSLNTVVIGNPINVSQALSRVGSGQDVWCKNQVIAFNLAKNFGNPVGYELHGPDDEAYINYFPHYHGRLTPMAMSKSGTRGKAHIYFTF
ncbi:hypothetical protein [Paenibacillus sp. BAC0078]